MTELLGRTESHEQAPVSYPHEIHITIAPPRNPRHFLRVCEELNLRPCVFDNEYANGQHMTDFLTASDHTVPTIEAIDIMEDQANEFTQRGFQVIRKKIETAPINPVAPKRANGDPRPADTTYFETHFDVELPGHNWLGRLALIEYMGPVNPVLLSVNRRKPNEFLTTYRLYGVYFEEFAERLESVQERMAKNYKITLADMEFAAFDTAPNHDKDWVASYYDAVY